MTFPCKEAVIAFEQLEKRERRIYPDAADSGVLLKDIRNLSEIRANLRELLDFFGKPEYDYKVETWGARTDRSWGKSFDFFIPIEYDQENGRKVEAGLKFHLSCCFDRTLPGGGFLSTYISHETRPAR